jgi:hypothetical protein
MNDEQGRRKGPLFGEAHAKVAVCGRVLGLHIVSDPYVFKLFLSEFRD